MDTKPDNITEDKSKHDWLISGIAGVGTAAVAYAACMNAITTKIKNDILITQLQVTGHPFNREARELGQAAEKMKEQLAIGLPPDPKAIAVAAGTLVATTALVRYWLHKKQDQRPETPEINIDAATASPPTPLVTHTPEQKR
jgi:hypothetical protein